jgi:hypothetical protein
MHPRPSSGHTVPPRGTGLNAENGDAQVLARVARELEAAAEALRRCAADLRSVGRPLTPSGNTQPRHADRQPPPLEERLSGRQLGAIRAISRRAGLSRDQLAQVLTETTGKIEPTLLTRAEASLVLDRLNGSDGSDR